MIRTVYPRKQEFTRCSHSMEFLTQFDHAQKKFITLFTPLSWSFQSYLPLSIPWNFRHFVSISNLLLGISSLKMPPSMKLFYLEKNALSQWNFPVPEQGGADRYWNSPN